MLIALNTLFLIPGKIGGMETVVRGLVRALAALDRSNEYVIFANRENAPTWDDLPENFSVFECPVRGTAKVSRTLYEQTKLASRARRLGVAVLHSLGAVAPPTSPAFRSVLTIPDLIYRRFPGEWTPLQRLVGGYLNERAARTVDRIITLSEFSKMDICKDFGVPPEKVSVIPPGCQDIPPDSESADRFFRDARISFPYIFSVGSTYYHKNLDGLLRAFQILRRRFRLPHRLVVSGLRMRAHSFFERDVARLGLARSVLWTGWVSPAVLRALYERADCFLFPSLYEGFGLPVLEAMALETPVACSNVTFLPEVAGDAAVTFDPRDPDAIADAVQRILDEPDLRRSLVEKGRARARTFTWERCARQTLELYLSLPPPSLAPRLPS
ncbi:MAG: glycosyltransferase family 1 protein [Planctomycetota bacterium]